MPANFITMGALLALVFVIAMQSGSKDDRGRGYFARIAAGTTDDSDRLFVKLASICLGVAFVAYVLLG